MRISDTQLKRIFPTLSRAKCRAYLPLLVAAMEEFGISTRKRACAFLAQVGHESADLKYFEELASGDAYDTRTDLGNTPQRDGDGRKYKGRGPIQITGATNYMRAGNALDLDLLTNPDLLEVPEHGFRAAAWWWQDRPLNQLADKLTLKANAKDLATFDKITKRVNGGYNGALDRQRRYLDCITVLADEDFEVRTVPLPGDETIRTSNETKRPENETNASDSGTNSGLFDKLSRNDRAKTAGRTAAQKLGNRLGTPLTTLFTALQAGNVYVWLGVAVLVIGLAVFIYLERHAIARAVTRLKAKL